MSHLIRICAVCKFSCFRLYYLKELSFSTPILSIGRAVVVNLILVIAAVSPLGLSVRIFLRPISP